MINHKNDKFLDKTAKEWAPIIGVNVSLIYKQLGYCASLEASLWYASLVHGFDLEHYLQTGEQKRLPIERPRDFRHTYGEGHLYCWHQWASRLKVSKPEFAKKFWETRDLEKTVKYFQNITVEQNETNSKEEIQMKAVVDVTKEKENKKRDYKQYEDHRFAGKGPQEWSAILGIYQGAVSRFARKSGSLEASVWYCAGMVGYDLESYLITGKGQFAEKKTITTLMCDELEWYSWCEKNKVSVKDFAMRYYQFKDVMSAIAWSNAEKNDISKLTAYKKPASYWAEALGVELSVIKYMIINHDYITLREAIYRLAYQKRIPMSSLLLGQCEQVDIQEEPINIGGMRETLKSSTLTIDKYRIAARAFTAERTKDIICLTEDDWNKILNAGDCAVQKVKNYYGCSTLTAVFYLSLIREVDIDAFIKDGTVQKRWSTGLRMGHYQDYNISDWSAYLKVDIDEFVDVALALKSIRKAAEYLGYQGESLPPVKHKQRKVSAVKTDNGLLPLDDKEDEKENTTMEEPVKENNAECVIEQFTADIDGLNKAFAYEYEDMAASMDQAINWARVETENIFDVFKTNAVNHAKLITCRIGIRINDMLKKASEIIAAKDAEIRKLQEQLDAENSEAVCPEWNKIVDEFPNATPERILDLLHGREAERAIYGSHNN